MRILGLVALLLVTALAGSASAATVSGTVTDDAGDPVPGVTLVLGPAVVETPADGSYALEVDPGSYTLTGLMQVGGDALGLPEDWDFFGPLTVSGDRAFDIRLPAARALTVQVLGAGDAPLEGARIELPSFDYGTRVSLGGEPGFRIDANPHAALTDAAGEYRTRVFDGTGPHLGARGRMTQPDDSDYLPTTFDVPILRSDTTVVVHAPQPSAHVTGTLRDGDGDPVPGVPLTLGPARDVTAADGTYSLGVNPGSYTFGATAPEDSGALGLPDSWFLSGSLRVTGDRTFDVTLPDVVTLTTRALDGANDDAPLEGALVDLPGWDLRGNVVIDGVPSFSINASAAQGTTDAAGETHALLFDGAEPHFGQRVTVTPPESTGYAPVTSPLPTLDGDTTVVVRAPVPFYWVSGVIRDDLGTPLAGVGVAVGAETDTTGGDGAYRVRVSPGGHGLNLAMPGAEAVGLPPNWTLSGSFTALGDRTLDVTLPKALHATTRVLGDDDEPVPGTVVSVPRFSYFFPLETLGELTNVQIRADALRRTTDANGEAFYTEFDGAQSTSGFPSRLDPPAESGYDSRTFFPSFNRFELLDVEHVHDSTAPTIEYGQSPDGANGWWSGRPATVHVTASDPRIDTLACTVDGVAPRRLGVVAGTGTLSADLTIRGEGRHAIACTAVDRSDNGTTESTAALIDLTNPLVPTLAADRAPDYAGGGGWYADTVTVTASGNGDPLLADGSAGSGVDPRSVPAPQTFSTSGRHVVAASVSDVAGNGSRTTRLSVRVDADAPTTTLSCPASVRLGVRANATWDDADGESGLVGSNHGRVALDTATPGLHRAEHAATDRVGHATTSSCTYTVV
jgi:hypothetical protein